MLEQMPKRPRDTNQLAKMIVDLTTGNPIAEEPSKLSPKALAGRMGGLKGGKARKASLTPARRKEIAQKLYISEEEAAWFVFTGEAINTTYNPYDEDIKILYKDGSVTDISKVDNALIHQQLYTPIKKYYLFNLNTK